MIVIKQGGERVEVHGIADMDPVAIEKHIQFIRGLAVGAPTFAMVGDAAPEILAPPAVPAMPPPKRGRKAKSGRAASGSKMVTKKKAAPKKAAGPKRARFQWTPEHDATFRELWAANASAEGIGDHFGVKPAAVFARAKALGLPRRKKGGAVAVPAEWPAPPTAKKEAAPAWATIDTVIAFLRERDITVTKDRDSVETPRWHVEGKGRLAADELLAYANNKRVLLGQVPFTYQP